MMYFAYELCFKRPIQVDRTYRWQVAHAQSLTAVSKLRMAETRSLVRQLFQNQLKSPFCMLFPYQNIRLYQLFLIIVQHQTQRRACFGRSAIHLLWFNSLTSTTFQLCVLPPLRDSPSVAIKQNPCLFLKVLCYQLRPTTLLQCIRRLYTQLNDWGKSMEA